MFTPTLPGQDLTASLINTSIDNAFQIEGLTADLTVSSTVFQDSSDLTLALTTNASYAIQCQFIFDSNTTADINIRFTTPLGTVLRLAPWGQSATGTNDVSQTATDSTTTTTIAYGGKGAGTFCLVRPAGAILSVGGAGNLVIGFAQTTASGSTVLKAGSMVALSRFF